MAGTLSAWDIVAVVVSLAVVFGIAILGGVQKRRENAGAAGFFLAGRSMPWWIIGGSLFASNIGTEHFVGQAGTAAHSGMAVGLYEWLSAYMILILGWVFTPVYLRCKLTTVPELLEKRYNRGCRLFYVVITLVSYVIAKVGSALFAGVIILEIVAGWGVWQSLPVILLMTAIYTISGGLTAVMLTDTVQMFIFVVGGIIGSIISLRLVGGIGGLFDSLDKAGLTEFPHLFRPLTDKQFPWLGMLFGVTSVAIWYWCVDQEMAQRVLSAPNVEEARLGTGFAGLLKALPVLITVFPGMAARALYEICKMDGDKFSDWCSTNLQDHHAADGAYPLLVIKEFPSGVRGVMIASFLAALMSSLSSVLNSASTIFTYDVYMSFPHSTPPSSKHLVLVGRLATTGLALLAFCWVPVVKAQPHGLYVCTQTAMTHISPPVSALFICGLFTRRTNGRGALGGVLIGSVLGITRLVYFLTHTKECSRFVDDDGQIRLTATNWFSCLNFNYFAMSLFGFTVILINVLSLFFPPPGHDKTKETMVEWPWPLRRKPTGQDYEKAGLLDTDEAALTKEGTLIPTSEITEDDGGVNQRKHIISICLAVVVVTLTTFLLAYFH